MTSLSSGMTHAMTKGEVPYIWCHSNINGSVHKKGKFQVSTIYTLVQPFVMMMHTFCRNWWQSGRSWYKDMKYDACT
jgi:hypothetical protein